MAKRLNPGMTVAGITVAALLGVGVLAVQAASSAPDDRGIARHGTPAPTGPSAEPVAAPAATRPAIPEASGDGKRVVYSVGQSRVWLVDEQNTSLRDYEVAPAPVKPQPGTFRVTEKQEAAQTGSDGLRITHSVRFGYAQGLPLGFAATDTPLEQITQSSGTAKPRASTTPARRSAGIREKTEDGEALWQFAPIGTPVVVVP